MATVACSAMSKMMLPSNFISSLSAQQRISELSM
jgi:hypothetical protein